MKYDVRFSHRVLTGNLDAVGPGAVYLDETGVVVEADFPRLYVPLVYVIIRRIIGATSTRTIPFSRITRYKQPGLFGGYHLITYMLPHGAKKTVGFKMREHRRNNDQEFSARFDEYRAAARAYLAG
jgi:hypothetical protein